MEVVNDNACVIMHLNIKTINNTKVNFLKQGESFIP